MNAPAVITDSSDLAATVERARALLDEGDVMAARMLASASYDQARTAAKHAAWLAASLPDRIAAGERLLDKARRLQGDALLIEARCNIRIADEVDAAQAAGAVAKGRPKTLPDGKTSATFDEIGLTHKTVHQARKLRDAERDKPGIVERAIAARLAAGLEPSRANLRAAIGTDTATKAERGNNLYETPLEAMKTLLALERFGPVIWEPACGRGAISRPLEQAGHEVALSDLVDYGTASKDGECQRVVDFLETTARDAPGFQQRPNGPSGSDFDIVTNPPYGEVLNRFVAHALQVHRPRKMALLLNLNFLAGADDADRNFALDAAAPARILVFTRRLPMMHRDGWNGDLASSRMNTAWFVWERDETGAYSGGSGGYPEIRRVDWKNFCTTAKAEAAE